MKAIAIMMQQAVEEGVFPGGVVLVAHKGTTVFQEAFGLARQSPPISMKRDTFFDLASLTKPLATAVSCMVLRQKNALSLDQPLGKILSPFNRPDKKDITIRQLLSHSSGLPAYQPYFKILKNMEPERRRDALIDCIAREPLAYGPGETCLYSDLDFLILQWIVEKKADTTLDRLLNNAVYSPLELHHLFFNTLRSFQGHREGSYAATEKCPWRGTVMDGEVHDDHAYLLGGVAGHAGLFGTAEGVLTLLQELLASLKGASHQGLFNQKTVATFFQKQIDTESWALGFDTPTKPESSSGKYFSDTSVGHLGFTGTSFWMDLEKEVIAILLTNRIHPTRANEKIKVFRPRLHDAVMEQLLGC